MAADEGAMPAAARRNADGTAGRSEGAELVSVRVCRCSISSISILEAASPSINSSSVRSSYLEGERGGVIVSIQHYSDEQVCIAR